MNDLELTDLENITADALQTVLTNGTWLGSRTLEELVVKHGLAKLMGRNNVDRPLTGACAREESRFDESEAPGWPEWAKFRLVLSRGAEVPAVVYFIQRPPYSMQKVFASGAGVPVSETEIEERP